MYRPPISNSISKPEFTIDWSITNSLTPMQMHLVWLACPRICVSSNRKGGAEADKPRETEDGRSEKGGGKSGARRSCHSEERSDKESRSLPVEEDALGFLVSLGMTTLLP